MIMKQKYMPFTITKIIYTENEKSFSYKGSKKIVKLFKKFLDLWVKKNIKTEVISESKNVPSAEIA